MKLKSKRTLLILISTLIGFACKKGNNISIEKMEIGASQSIIKNTGLTSIERTINRAKILNGKFIPLYGSGKNEVTVDEFSIDVFPVTNQEYLTFVKQNKNWRRSNVKKIFSDENYLRTWLNDTTLGVNMSPNAPITNVSWFAANAYCDATNARLPTVDEWEYVAMADEERKDARTKKSYNQYILDWYEKGNTYKNDIGSTYKNKWGVYDMHGLVWEWTSDFNSILISGENRGSETNDKSLFCGSGSLGASDLMNYAAFMRYAFRSSLKANFCVKNLGFRTIKKESKK